MPDVYADNSGEVKIKVANCLLGMLLGRVWVMALSLDGYHRSAISSCAAVTRLSTHYNALYRVLDVGGTCNQLTVNGGSSQHVGLCRLWCG